ncbi:MAG: YegP family protein [Vampirovibrionia bacterium]
MNDTLYFYVDTRGEHRWQIKASNGRIIGASTEGYINKSDCQQNARHILHPRYF